MLPTGQRLREKKDFMLCFSRKSLRSVNKNLIVYFYILENDADLVTRKVGFVVSKIVGNAVKRNIVKRRIRNIVKEINIEITQNFLLVIRCLENAEKQTYQELKYQVNDSIEKIYRKILEKK